MSRQTVMDRKSKSRKSRTAESKQGSRLDRLAQSRWAVAVLLAAALLAFGQTVRFDFTGYDDDALIVNRLPELQATNSPLRFFTEPTLLNPRQTPFYRPLLMLSFWLDARISGRQPVGYHAANVLYHLLAVWALFALLQRLLADRPTAFVLALLFAIHPAHTQAVAWIPGRNDVLLSIAAFLSLRFWLDWRHTQNTVHFFLHLLFFLMALFTKETAVVLPLVSVLLFFSLRQPWAMASLLPAIAGWMVISGLWFWLRQQALAGAPGLGHFPLIGPLEALLGLSTYAVKAILPLRLSPYPVSHDIALTWEAGALMLLLVFSYAGFRDRRLAWFGLAWFGIWLAPTFVQGAEEINFLEPRMYAALPGMLLFLAQVHWQRFKIPLRWRPVLLAGVAGFFLLQSWTYARAFVDPEQFWTTMQTRAPRSAFTYYGLGNLFMQKQAYDEAVRAYRRAIELKPDYARAYFNLGNAYYRLGQMQQAEDAYRKSLHYFPGFAKARVNLAAVFFNRANRLRDEGEYGRAIEFYQKAIELNPSFVEAYNNLGVLLSKMGKTHQGLVVFRRALALDPDLAETHLNLAIAYFARRAYDLAIAHCDRALQLGAQVDEAFLKALAPYRKKPE